MADDIAPSQDQAPDAGVEEQQEVTQDVGGEQQPGDGYNPAWEPLRQQLGLQFETIKPELAKIDKSFNEHVTKVNGQYAPWKQFAEQGITPEQVSQAFTMLQRLNDNPEEIHAALGKFLQENGRLPQTASEAAQVAEDAEEDGDEYLSDEAKEIKALKKKLADFEALITGQTEQAQQAAEAAQREAMVVQAEQELQQEFIAFKTAHPGISDEDMLEIQQRHYFYALQGPEHIRSLEDVGKEFFALQERIRSTPRPTDKAPRLPGAGGAVPQGQAKDPSEYSREESQEALAALLMQGRQQ